MYFSLTLPMINSKRVQYEKNMSILVKFVDFFTFLSLACAN